MKTFIAIVVIAAALAILRPWTVVPIQTGPARTFAPSSYVASIWESRVIPSAESSAIELEAFMQLSPDLKVAGSETNPGARAVFVKGTARIADVDRASRVGLARLNLPWAKDAQRAAIQIGPVLRGTAVRDALDFIRFTDFVNQIEFAEVAGALNDRVAGDVLGSTGSLVAGAEITFVGAVSVSASTQTLEIVPVKLEVTARASELERASHAIGARRRSAEQERVEGVRGAKPPDQLGGKR